MSEVVAGSRRPFEFACGKCGEPVVAYLTDVRYRWRDRLLIDAGFESDHTCHGLRAALTSSTEVQDLP